MINPCGLHVVVGPTGSGKSMFQMQWVGRILATTKRTVVTNLPIKWEGLAEQMNYEYPRKSGSWTIDELRVRVYQTEDLLELQKFWLCFGHGWTAIDIEKEAYELGYRPDYSVVYRYKESVMPANGAIVRRPLYRLLLPEVLRLVETGEVERRESVEIPSTEILIDEAGSVFPQRAKAGLGRAYTHALEHKRKIRPEGLNVVMACQFPNQLDSEIRNQANSWTYLVNFASRRRGMFRLPKRSVWQQFPTQPREHDKPDITGHFKIDPGEWGRTYDTSAGVGLMGGTLADTKSSVGGISWLWFFPIVAVVIVALVLVVKQLPGGLGSLSGWIIGRKKPAAAVATVQTNSVHVETNSPVLAELRRLSEQLQLAAAARKEAEERERQKPDRIGVTSLAQIGKELKFSFVDGSRGSSNDRRFGGLLREGSQLRGLLWEGREYEFKDAVAHKLEMERIRRDRVGQVFGQGQGRVATSVSGVPLL